MCKSVTLWSIRISINSKRFKLLSSIVTLPLPCNTIDWLIDFDISYFSFMKNIDHKQQYWLKSFKHMIQHFLALKKMLIFLRTKLIIFNIPPNELLKSNTSWNTSFFCFVYELCLDLKRRHSFHFLLTILKIVPFLF